MTRGLDYAFSPTGDASFWRSRAWLDALDAYGAKFVCRYISSYAPNVTNGKCLTRPERDALIKAGISIVLVFEEDAGRMRSGRGGGVHDAQYAASVATALGLSGAPVYFAADWDAAPAEQAAINAYLDGAASVIGRDRTGIYGGFYVVNRALDAGKAAFAWQTVAWSGGQWDPRANIRQGLSLRLSGASVDPDESRTGDYGQWPRPQPRPAPAPAAPAAPEDDDMFYLQFSAAGKTRFPVPVQYLRGDHKLCFAADTDCQVRVQYGDRDETRDLGAPGASSNMDLPGTAGAGGLTVHVTRLGNPAAIVSCAYSERS